MIKRHGVVRASGAPSEARVDARTTPSSYIREAAVFVFFLALAIAMTWPLASHLGTAVADLGDPLVNTWILDWVCHALTHAPLHLYDAPTYYPGHLSLALSENLVGIALLVLPFHLAGVPPITLYNIAMLLGFALSGYGAFVLARVITKSAPASLVAGVFFAFVPFKFDHVSHLQLIWSGWIPLLLAAVIAYWRAPSKKLAACIAAALVMNGLTNVYYFLFASLTAALTIVAYAILDPWRDRKFWTTLIAAFVIGGIVLAPFLLPYRIVSKEYGLVRTEGEARSGSAPAKAWLVTTPNNILYGKLGPQELHRHEMQLFPGLVALILAVIGAGCWVQSAGQKPLSTQHSAPSTLLTALIALTAIFTWLAIITDRIEWSLFGHRILSFNSADVPATLLVTLLVIRFRHVRSEQPERWAAALWVVIGVIGSFGMNAFFHQFLYRRVHIFAAIRAPVRWAIIAYAGIAVFAALGALALMRRRVPAIVLIALAAVDLWPSIRWEAAVPTPAPVYRWLAHARVAPLVELPLSGGSEFQYLYGSIVHHLPQFNGIEPFSSPVYARLREKNDALQFDDEFLSLLEKNGCRLIIVHVHALGDKSSAVRAWLAQHLADHRLEYLRSFDHELGGDFVFGLTKNYRGEKEPDVPDGAGHLPAQRVARMLAGESTHSNAITTVIESPQYGELVRGPLHVRGWTLSPFRVTRVTALLGLGKVRVDAPLVDERPDVKQKYFWYYFVARPGFELIIPERPGGIHRATDLQIEVEDESGRVMRTPDVVLTWERTQ
ncbi:MAG: hypothetical protein DMF56_19825 [Acidobacteria bacterium]|nr:MAG: hypothetical protein DMF56_19825 [Acidobacteriota bacterium]